MRIEIKRSNEQERSYRRIQYPHRLSSSVEGSDLASTLPNLPDTVSFDNDDRSLMILAVHLSMIQGRVIHPYLVQVVKWCCMYLAANLATESRNTICTGDHLGHSMIAGIEGRWTVMQGSGGLLRHLHIFRNLTALTKVLAPSPVIRVTVAPSSERTTTQIPSSRGRMDTGDCRAQGDEPRVTSSSERRGWQPFRWNTMRTKVYHLEGR